MAVMGPGATFMYLMAATWLFLGPFLMVGLGVLSAARRPPRRRAGLAVTAGVMLFYVGVFAVAGFRGFSDPHFFGDVVVGSLVTFGWLALPWLIAWLLTRRSARRADDTDPLP
ncbi:hypothetical protein [Thermomonospora cellulosilytica]|uniref:Uncharacterized membrane protein (DUF485 family) n=1 Tax=Thermomonospora cellulosilytica TaxID=1411118 RepID=A0A7W3RB38_9ACTN|nr:hypothetical protein [Thermomonospora cellulosilytica]MBA9006329.1 uncharacterized membrane protein (DUF485 family) [Thermomonospora cellulosilytica]